MGTIRILLADDHDIVRDGIRALLGGEPSFHIIGEAENGREALKFCRNNAVDFIIMDINMPELSGIEATEAVKEEFDHIKVLALTMLDEDEHIRKMIEAGASGYILKNSDKEELVDAIQTIHNGDHYFSDGATKSIMLDLVGGKKDHKIKSTPNELTPREKEVIVLIAQELTNKEIAEELYISVRTVDAHRRNLMQKTGARNTAGLVRYALKHNLCSLE
jgi:DNA-binding NarL/FixJ family response regulator